MIVSVKYIFLNLCLIEHNDFCIDDAVHSDQENACHFMSLEEACQAVHVINVEDFVISQEQQAILNSIKGVFFIELHRIIIIYIIYVSIKGKFAKKGISKC